MNKMYWTYTELQNQNAKTFKTQQTEKGGS